MCWVYCFSVYALVAVNARLALVVLMQHGVAFSCLSAGLMASMAIALISQLGRVGVLVLG